MNGLEHQLLRVCIEVTLVALVVVVLTRFTGEKRPRFCAWLWLLVPLKAGLVLIPLTYTPFSLPLPETLNFSSEPDPGSYAVAPVKDASGVKAPESSPARSSPSPATGRGSSASGSTGSLILPIWLIGFLTVLGWHVLGRIQIERVRRSAIPQPTELTRFYNEEARRCGLAVPPDMVVNSEAIGPLVTYGPKPSLFLPAELVEKTSPEQLRWVLRHELTHIRHLDHLSLLVWAVAGMVFWFHPIIWWAQRQWRREMEQACDDAVAETPSDARHYAEALYSVLKSRFDPSIRRAHTAGLAATRTEIGGRIKRLLSRGRLRPSRVGGLALVGWSGGAVAVGLFGFESATTAPDTSSINRTELRIDFGPDDQRVEPGWEGWSEDRDRDYSNGFDLDFEIEIDRGPAWRDNGEVEGSVRWVSMMRDGIRERDDDFIRIKMKNLDAGDYLLELTSFNGNTDPSRSGGRFTLWINGRIRLADQTTAREESLSGAFLPPVSFQSDGREVVVELERLEGEIWLNGLILSGTTRWTGDLRLGRIALSDAPQAVQDTIARELADATLDDVRRRERNDELVYSIDADTTEGDLELEIAPDGSLLERQEEIPEDLLPLPIREALTLPGASMEVRKATHVTEMGEQTYVIDVRLRGDRARLVYDQDGNLVGRGDR